MSDLVSASSLVPKERRRWSAGLLVAVLGLAAAFAIKVLWIKTGVLDAMSTDDAMRLVEVRDLINGQAWSDLHQYRLDPPGLLMHWSRLIDLPLALSILLLKPLLGTHQAELVTLTLWPLLLFAVALALVAAIARQMSGGAPMAMLGALVLAMLAMPALAHFRPGSIDHHNAQIVLVLAMMLFALQIERSAFKAACAGVAASASLAVGVEMLPAIATVGVAVAGLFIWRGAPVARQVSAFAGALAASSLGFALLLLPLSTLAAPVMDALGGPLLLLTVGGGAGLILMVGLDRLRSSPPLRLVAAMGVAAALLAASYLLFGKSLMFPYAQLDPLVVSLWLDNVQETISLPKMLRLGPEEALGFYACPVIALGVAVAAMLRSDPSDRFRWGIVILTLASLLGVSLWEMRGAAGAAMVAAPVFAAGVAVLWPSLAMGGNLVLLAFVVSPAMFATLSGTAKPLIAAAFKWEPLVFDDPATMCRSVSDATPMRRLPKGRVMAPTDIGPAILVETDHEVFAAPYHRNNDGNLAFFQLMLAPGLLAHQILLDRQVDYVVTCRTAPNRLVMGRAPNGLEAMLFRGETPGFLEPVDVGPSAKIAVWRVRK
ncbi:hypothetical protein HL667_02720 [Bradyrhizobium sp. 83012]|uniref:AcrB/AcrD/AcrF family protein n=1 Tax=Bradyrhizobium aeschynomenes TaxID=2734909 RepID=A0ABX2C8R5_9BRAD|nr:hypothetical protein [Bradyrhizobium aeschynomenes]NPU63905.1 hypothetical protein [Bradyrhizobium aeschynomenes]